MTYPFGETVIHLDGTAPITQDDLGNDVRTFPVKATYTGIAVWPRGGNELTQGQDLVTVGLTISIPDDVTVDAQDRFIVRGETFEVQGDPQPYRSPLTGRRPGSPVALQRVT
jgi:hypothetical protein